MNRRRFLQFGALGASSALLAACTSPAATPGAVPAASLADIAASGSVLEIFSWWTTGGEVEALDALYEIFSAQYPDVEIRNAALAGGAGQGGNIKALLEARMMGGHPPDSFQVHLGRELIDSHVIPGRMEPLDWLYEEEGLNDLFPQQLIDIASYDGKPWSVPLNIHRSNVLWYRTDKFEQVGVKPPATWDEFFAVAEAFKAAGVPALAASESEPNHSGHMFESVLNAVMEPDQYRGLFNGSTAWGDLAVTEALEILNRAYEYANEDYLTTAPSEIWDRFTAGNGPAMHINGDWAHGALVAKGFTNYRWTPSPGTEGTFIVLSDSFGLPVGAPHRDNAVAFLRICASRKGQDAFNPIKGSIPARTDPDLSLYDEYLLSAMEDFASDTLVPSIQHGAAAKQSFVLEYATALSTLANTRDVARAQAELVKAAEEAGFAA
jgi:glucose/mannose transport system substrate-binding protein